MIITLTCLFTYCSIGERRWVGMHSFLAVAGVVVVYVMDGHSDMCRSVKILGFLLCILQSIFIIASRKHYSVDIVIAWYVNQLIL